MAIVVNNPAERTIETRDSGGSDAVSWMMALAVIIILALGAFYLLPRIAARAPAPATPGTNIQVTLPAGSGVNEAPAGGNGGAVTPQVTPQTQ